MLALIVGMGALPAELVARLPERPLICQLSEFEPDGLKADLMFRLEHLGTLIGTLKERGVAELCMAGSIRRPTIDPAAIDPATMPLVPVIQRALTSGDDGALRAMIAVFEDAGIAVRAAHEIAPELLMSAGCPTTRQPGDGDKRDAERAEQIVRALSAADVGQSCIVRKGQALALEGVFGTDWMINSLKARPDGSGGLLFKAPKAGQDRRADLPTIGPATVEAAAAAGLDGLVIEAGGVIVLHREAVLKTCDAQGVFFWVRDP